jgi:AcrR family transcriptional regulator
MSKQTILITSLNIFSHFGIKGVSISQIANSIRISKRTLYSYFSNKEELLSACMEYEDENISTMLEEIEKQTNNPVGLIVSLAIKMSRYRSSYCPAFYKDIMHFYNANLRLNAIYNRIRNQFAVYFNDGVEDGFFLQERNYELIAYVLMEQMILQSQSRISSLHRSTVFITFLRGLCTQKGLLMLEELLPSEEEKCVYNYEYDF